MPYDHDANTGPSDVSVRGPFGVVAVRGTRFFAGRSNGVFGVFVERGAVTVTGVRTTVLLAAGQGTNLERQAQSRPRQSQSRPRQSQGARPASPVRWRR